MLTHQEKKLNALKKVFWGMVSLGTLAFVSVNIYPIVHGPAIHIENITNGETFSSPVIELSGRARFTKDLMVNGVVLPTSPEGSFDEKLVLTPGYNIISVSGKDRFGTITEKNYAFVLEEHDSGLVTLVPMPSDSH